MEKERKINWLGLFIKIIIIFVFILIIIWLVSKIASKTRLSNVFKNNIANMETVATNYFKEVDLPLEKGKSSKITLGEMIDKGLIVSVKDKNGTSCDTSKSFSKITRKKNNYILATTLKCGAEKNTITKKFSLNDCRNCNQKANTTNDIKKDNSKDKVSNSENKNVENQNPNMSENSNPSATGITYYEYVKETTVYSKWMKGNITGNNVENKNEYYAISKDTYYSLGVIKDTDFKVGKTINYTLKLNNVPNPKYYFPSVESSSYYVIGEEHNYLNEKDVTLNKGNYKVANSISNYSLTSNNFTYNLSPYYRKGNFYVDVEVTIINTNGVSAYKSDNINIYYIPLKLNMKFASDQITTTIPSDTYETITYYRYIETNRDTIWSAENSVEGYTKTGNSEVR